MSCNLVESHDEKPNFNYVNEINVINVNGSNHKVISNDWGAKILSESNKIIFRDAYNLYTINYDGSNVTELTNLTNTIFDYNISTNGQEIVLSIYENNPVRLYLINSDGTNFTQLTNSDGADLEASFSDNLNEIVFRRDWNICTINSDGTEFQYVIKHPDSSYFRNPYFIYNNTIILYLEETKTSNYIIHLYDINKQVDSILSNLHQPILDISSKGEILFNEEIKSEESSIKIMDIMKNEIKEIAKGQYASFSSDGNKIVYSNGKQINLIDLNGNNEILIFKEDDEKRWILNPRLSPDDKYIVFETSYSVQVN